MKMYSTLAALAFVGACLYLKVSVIGAMSLIIIMCCYGEACRREGTF